MPLEFFPPFPADAASGEDTVVSATESPEAVDPKFNLPVWGQILWRLQQKSDSRNTPAPVDTLHVSHSVQAPPTPAPTPASTPARTAPSDQETDTNEEELYPPIPDDMLDRALAKIDSELHFPTLAVPHADLGTKTLALLAAKRHLVESVVAHELRAWEADTRAVRDRYRQQMATRVLKRCIGVGRKRSFSTPPLTPENERGNNKSPRYRAHTTDPRQALRDRLADEETELLDVHRMRPGVRSISVRTLREEVERQSALKNGKFVLQQRRSREEIHAWLCRINRAIECGWIALLDKEIGKRLK